MDFSLIMKHYTLILLTVTLFAGCIGKKKHLEIISNLEKSHSEETGGLNAQLNQANQSIKNLTLELATAKGANEALIITQDKLQQRIDDLQAEIDRLKSRATNQQDSFGAELQAKEKELAFKTQQLTSINNLLEGWDKDLEPIAAELRQAFADLSADQYDLEIKNGRVTVIFMEKLLFKPGSTSKVENNGVIALEKIAALLKNNPELSLRVVGHTDNQPIPRNSLDRWDYSMLRAGTVVKILTEDFDLGSNRVLAAGKSEFEPRTSNETPEGRAQNKRVELIIYRSEELLIRDLRRVLAR